MDYIHLYVRTSRHIARCNVQRRSTYRYIHTCELWAGTHTHEYAFFKKPNCASLCDRLRGHNNKPKSIMQKSKMGILVGYHDLCICIKCKIPVQGFLHTRAMLWKHLLFMRRPAWCHRCLDLLGKGRRHSAVVVPCGAQRLFRLC